MKMNACFNWSRRSFFIAREFRYLCGHPIKQKDMIQFSSETLQFIQAHRTDDVCRLALRASKYPDVDMAAAVEQITGWQTARKKLPEWAQTEGIVYPRHLSMEQCSSELTARYKASLAEGESFADLTAGFGVDCTYMARKFREADYVERQERLCEQAVHNFPLLGVGHVRVHCADALDYLREMEPVDWLFLDPARRDSHGGKTVKIADCEPDVSVIEPLLVEKGRTVMIKLSPMLDIFSVLKDLKHVCEIHVVAVNNECKELLVILRKSSGDASEPLIYCEQAVDNFLSEPFRFTYSEERESVCPLAVSAGAYLYEPGAALLKAGPYRLLAARYGLKKLHPNSHLYTSDSPVDFPGRRFRVEGVSGFGKMELKELLRGVDKANLTVRNFPASVADLRKKLKLKEGGDVYLFATTMGEGEKVLMKCVKA